jgi:hypothetical protein
MRRLFPAESIRWRDRHSVDGGNVLSSLVDEYRRWIQHTLKEYEEIPCGYTEWSVTGHLAVAAGRLGLYSLQEYYVERKVKANQVPTKRRPDLYVTDKKHDYVFEIKKTGIELGDRNPKIEQQVAEHLLTAHRKLYDYKGEAEYRCSLVFIEVWVKMDDWKQKYHLAPSYRKAVKGLGNSLSALLQKLPSGRVNFSGGFLCTHPEARTEYEKAQKAQWSPFPVGAAFIGYLEPQRTTR